MSRHDLTDEQWAVIAPLIPKRTRRRGRPRNEDRKTLNGILSVLKTGCAWADLPTEYGSDTTCWRRLQAWSADGTWERVWRALLSQLDAQDKLEGTQACLDGRFVPAKKGGEE
ncbi:MAG: IS5 family transposase [Anaerolineae bacterium]|nr:IS5 family transposase [Candidatus Roseilinea sp.]MDW8448775.1 IS5 family transposase [Anaerolineae bacterium]